MSLSRVGENAESPVLAENESGDAIAAWERVINGYNTALEVAVRPRGSRSFLPASDVNEPAWATSNPDVTVGNNINPKVAVAPDGSMLVLWVRETRVFGMSIPPGARSGARFVLADVKSSNPDVYVGIDRNGGATALWQDGDEAKSSYRPPGATSFGPSETIPIPPVYYAYWTAEVGRDGTAAAAWASAGNYFVSVRPPGGDWRAPSRIDAEPGTNGYGPPSLVVDDSGGTVLSWWDQRARESGDVGRIRATYVDRSGDVGTPVTLSNANYAYETTSAADHRGDVAVAWQGGSSQPDLQAAITMRLRDASGTWGPPEAISLTTGAEEPPALAFDSVGDLFATWRLYEDRANWIGRVWANTRPAGESFGTPAPLVSGNENIWPPQVAAGPAGTATVVYNRGTFPDAFRVEAVDGRSPISSDANPTAPATPNDATSATSPVPETPVPAESSPGETSASPSRPTAAASGPTPHATTPRLHVVSRIVAGRATAAAKITFVPAESARLKLRVVTRASKARPWRTAGQTIRTVRQGVAVHISIPLSRATALALSRHRAVAMRLIVKRLT